MTDSRCDVCGKPTEGDLCEEHDSSPILYHLDDSSGMEKVKEGYAYLGEVNAVMDYGAFVSLNEEISGLIHESNLSQPVDVGDDIKVRVSEIREDGDISLVPVHMHDYLDAYLGEEEEFERTPVNEMVVGDSVSIEGEVQQIKQTGGPTIFTVGDETGSVECAAFVEAGVRAFPEVDNGDFIRLYGNAETREGDIQVETDEIEVLEDDEAEEVEKRLEKKIEDRANPADLEPLIESESLQELYPGIREIAKEIRKAVFTGHPVIVRHHADGDGISSGAVVEKAVRSLIDETSSDPEAEHHLFSRRPSKAPYYEMEDVTRDLNYALEDVKRHGHSTPILLMLDNGSTSEDTEAYDLARTYDIPIYIIDHHSPDQDEVEEYVEKHVNPYLVGKDYSITSGMMCTELARLINPGIENDIKHVPAVAGKADRSEAEEMNDYLELAEDKGYEESHAEDIADALDYQAYWLKYDDGRHLVDSILDIEDNDVHRGLVKKLKKRADDAFEDQMDAALPHVQEQSLDNGAVLYSLDVENYARRFTYPAPGKTTGNIHDVKVDQHEEPVVTIGYGPDFCVIRGEGVEMDIPQIVNELSEEIEGGGVDGGGHLVVGSIKFVKGMRDEVIAALIDKIEQSPVE
ncbi:MAG: DHH family phosphoesterase [Halobacteria archaeon]